MKGKLVAGFRRLFMYYWPAKKDLIKWNRIKKDGVFKLQCAKCLEWFREKDIQVDHITPVGKQPDLNSKSVSEYVGKLFINIDGLQILCRDCHFEKTKIDRKEIKNAKQNNNQVPKL